MRPNYARLAALFALAALPRLAAGQASCQINNAGSCITQITGTLPVQYVVKLTLSTTTVTLSPADYSAFNATYAVNAGPAITVQANGAWILGIKANATTWTGTGAVANPSKPASELAWGLTPTGTFYPLTMSSAALANGSATAAQPVSFYFKANWSWTADPPGNYSLGVTLTLTTP